MLKNLKIFQSKEVPTFIWFFLPIIIFFSIFAFKHFNYDFFYNFFKNETGFIENGTFVILFFSIITSIFILKTIKKKGFNKIIYFWILFFLFGLVYFAGEEISWGQQWFNWETFSFFKELNDQSETNFHNINSWFDQKPRFLLLCFVFVGGIFIPIFFRNKRISNQSIKYWIYPTICCLPASLICLFFYLLDNLYKSICRGTPGIDIRCDYIPGLLLLRTSEIIEFYIAFFLFVYVLSIYLRLKRE